MRAQEQERRAGIEAKADLANVAEVKGPGPNVFAPQLSFVQFFQEHFNQGAPASLQMPQIPPEALVALQLNPHIGLNNSIYEDMADKLQVPSGTKVSCVIHTTKDGKVLNKLGRAKLGSVIQHHLCMEFNAPIPVGADNLYVTAANLYVSYYICGNGYDRNSREYRLSNAPQNIIDPALNLRPEFKINPEVLQNVINPDLNLERHYEFKMNPEPVKKCPSLNDILKFMITLGGLAFLYYLARNIDLTSQPSKVELRIGPGSNIPDAVRNQMTPLLARDILPRQVGCTIHTDISGRSIQPIQGNCEEKEVKQVVIHRGANEPKEVCYWYDCSKQVCFAENGGMKIIDGAPIAAPGQISSSSSSKATNQPPVSQYRK